MKIFVPLLLVAVISCSTPQYQQKQRQSPFLNGDLAIEQVYTQVEVPGSQNAVVMNFLSIEFSDNDKVSIDSLELFYNAYSKKVKTIHSKSNQVYKFQLEAPNKRMDNISNYEIDSVYIYYRKMELNYRHTVQTVLKKEPLFLP